MSGEINNREYRKQVIRELLEELHHGKSVDEVKEKFEKAFDGVGASEISEAEQSLIQGGMPIEEVQRLCDVHAAVFKDTLLAGDQQLDETATPGHPAHTLKEENRALEHFFKEELEPAAVLWCNDDAALPALREALNKLRGLNIHYQRKENLFFPYMEKHGITAPPKVMWGVDDEIRTMIKHVIELTNEPDPDKSQVSRVLEETITKIKEMIFKEDNILLPMVLEAFSEQEWKLIADESDELGYFLISQPPAWSQPTEQPLQPEESKVSHPSEITLPTGVLQQVELTHMLDTLPIDITFVGKDDTVRYFSQGTERIFPRTKAIIGRKVVNCHPPESMHIVEGIIADFKTGKKTNEDFWIRQGDRYIYIRYFAVKDTNGGYLGALEVTQDIAPIQQIVGEKRLVEME